MEKKRNILELRQRLDKTLALPDLVDQESIKSLVKDQLIRSSFFGNEGDIENVLARRSKEVSDFLEMLRSASGNKKDSFKAHGASGNDWKMKQDDDQLRVLYREGPEGTPYHTLLAEGCADGPIDVCMCTSWESTLYKKWWPQYNIPTFKITMSTCLQKVRIGEEISLVRMKVPWPISDREVILHYFEIEYFKEDLILILINTISDTEHIDVSSHGFTRDGIPEVKDAVRMDLVGGFVLQKVDTNRSYFRAIANMDIKLDFVPPALINFLSRQLIGNGHKLYQKVVSSVATSDDDYCEALRGPMYVRIREGLDSGNKHKIPSVCLEEKRHTSEFTEHLTDETYVENPQEKKRHTNEFTEDLTDETYVENPQAFGNTFASEIVEVEDVHNPHLEGLPSMKDYPTTIMTDQKHIIQRRPLISPEVEHALGILDRVIAIVHGGGLHKIQSDCSQVDHEFPTVKSVAEAYCLSDEEPPKNSSMEKLFNEDEDRSPAGGLRCKNDGSASSEAHVDSESLKEGITASDKTEKNVLSCSSNKLIGAAVKIVQPAFLDNARVCDEESLQAYSFHENGPYGETKKPNIEKKHRLCCFSLSFIRGWEHR